jgi:Tol biopolymer transport system component
VLEPSSTVPHQPAATERAVVFGGLALLPLLALAGCGTYEPGTLPETRAVTADAAWDGEAAVSPDGRNVAFVSERGAGGRGLFLVATDGKGAPRELAGGPGDVSRPSWSKDGKTILFTRVDAAGVGRTFLVPIKAGSAAAAVALGERAGDVRDAVFSPDGSRVAGIFRTDSTSALVEVVYPAMRTRPLLEAGTGPAPSHPTWGLKGKGIAFAWNGDLWWLGRFGSPPERLTFTGAAEKDPEFSPDGRWLAFVSDSTGIDNVWLARLEGGDGKKPAKLSAWRPASATFQPLGHPAWSRNGRTLWFERQDPWAIVAVDADGGSTDTLSSSLWDSRTPSFMGDDTQVVFAAPRTGPSRLWLMAAAGEAKSGPAKQLTQGPGEDVSPDGSKASGQIVYVNEAKTLGVATLALTDGTGEKLDPLTDLELAGVPHSTRDADPAWSPDGRAVAFASNRAGVRAIWVIEGVGRRVRLVTVAEGDVRTPRWSPDGLSIFYSAAGPTGDVVWRVPAAGGASEPWTSGAAAGDADFEPAPAPDGSRFVFTRRHQGDCDLYVLQDGVARPLVTNPRGQDAHANWSSDGRRLVYETGGAVNLYRADVRPLLLR